jgi:NAD(P)-dependent dehydrogenase (short-subunit alcohol dehydrogenase family)
MQKNSCGRVVNISNLAYLGIPGNADLAAAKSGLFGLTRSIARKIRQHVEFSARTAKSKKVFIDVKERKCA